jgi:hypothetical protein
VEHEVATGLVHGERGARDAGGEPPGLVERHERITATGGDPGGRLDVPQPLVDVERGEGGEHDGEIRGGVAGELPLEAVEEVWRDRDGRAVIGDTRANDRVVQPR